MPQFASISFVGSNGTLLENYTNVSDLGLKLKKHANTTGPMELQSNVAVLSASQANATRAQFYASGDTTGGGVPASNEYDVAATLVWKDTTQIPGLLLRTSTTDSSGYIVFYGTSGWQAGLVNAAGSTALLGSGAAWTPQLGRSYSVTAQVRNIGTAGHPVFLLFMDGAPILLNGAEDSAATITGANKAGLHLRQQTGSSAADVSTLLTGVQFLSLSATDGAGLYAGLTSGGPYTAASTQLSLAPSGVTVYLHGANTTWLTTPPGFTLTNTTTGASISGSATIDTDTEAHLTIIAGGTTGTFTLTDHSTGQVVTLSVIATPVVKDLFPNSTGSAFNLDRSSPAYNPAIPADATWVPQPGSNGAGSAVVTTAGTVRASAVGRTHYLVKGPGSVPDDAQPTLANYDALVDMLPLSSANDFPGILLRASTTDPSAYIVYYSPTSLAWILGRYDTSGTLTNNIGVAADTLSSAATYNLKAHIETDPSTGKVTVQLFKGTGGGGISTTAALTAYDDPLVRGGQITAIGHAGLHWNVQGSAPAIDGAATNFDNFYVYNAPGISLNPAQVTVGTTTDVSLVGVGTTWSTTTPTFGLSGGTGASMTQTIISDTLATLHVTAGSQSGVTLVITDPSTSTQTGLAVVPVVNTIPVTDPNWYHSPWNWFSDGAGAMAANNVHGSSAYVQSANMGAYALTVFNKTTARLMVAGAVDAEYMYIAWSIDSGPLQTHKMTTGDNTAGILLTPTPLADAQHTLRYYFYQATSSSPDAGNRDRWTTPTQVLKVTGLQLDSGAALSAPTLQAGRLLVFGDSLTEGFFSIADINTLPINSNAYYSYAFSVAQALSAEVGVVGWGSTGWCVNNSTSHVPPFDTPNSDNLTSWNKYSAGKSRLVAGKLSPIPDMVVVNHGRNDARSDINIPDATVQAAVTDWLAAIRAAVNTTTPIVVSIPFSGAKRDAITTAFTTYQSAHADPALYLVDLGTAVQPGVNANLYGGSVATGATEASPDGSHLYAHTAGRLGAALAHAIQQATGLTSIGVGSKVLKRGR